VERFRVETPERECLVDVTARVEEAAARGGRGAGAVLVAVPHTTAAVLVNEGHDPDVARDILAGLDRLVPAGAGWRHAEGNSPAHVKAALVGTSVVLPVEGGRLALGRWQRVFLCEFDGPRRRELWVQRLAGPAG
jgi:secondary thiamine-phosphate synthase enzyme